MIPLRRFAPGTPLAHRAVMRFFAALLALLLPAGGLATTVRELTRIRGEGEYILQGMGLVIGLKGTGDSGKELAVARPLAELYKNSGNELNSPRELLKANAAALVMVTCIIPERGARADDRYDVRVSTLYSASSIAGGQLFLTALKGPFPDSPVYAIAEGLIDISDPNITTVGVVRRGARLFEDIVGPQIGDTFDLVIDAPYAGWAAASQIAIAINGKADPIGNAVAVPVDERLVRITIPPAERANRAAFLADVFAAEVNPALLDLPAQVVVNQRTGAIIITGDVQVRPVAITQKDLSITTVVPAPTPTPLNPQVTRTAWTELTPGSQPADTARLSDLIAAFKQLAIPVPEQINILQMMHKSGQLQAKLVID